MASGFVIRKSRYYDLVFLMHIAKALNAEPGVTQSAVLMATDENKGLLAEIGIAGPAIQAATANDLVVALIADQAETVERLLAGIDARLQSSSSFKMPANYRLVDDALLASPASNLVVVSVPGPYAAREARKALEHGKHVFLFSDNVPLEQEAELKRLAHTQGRLLMGPDCATSLIGGVGIGFANRVRRGPVGAVGAAGTGLQEFTSLVHQAGSGISHAIGTGSRDLSDAVGGITTLMALDALEADRATRVIAILSKPDGTKTLRKLLDRIRRCSKPVVGCFLGLDHLLLDEGPTFTQAHNIDEAVSLALRQVGIEIKPILTERRRTLRQVGIDTQPFLAERSETLRQEIRGWRPEQRYLRGLFAGGTFCYQTQQVLRAAGLTVYSNAPLDKRYRLENPDVSREHSVIDLGDAHFTLGKPHPMIDAAERRKRILAEAADPEVAILVLDFILGSISSPDPAGDLVQAIVQAKTAVRRRAGTLAVVASVCGTDQDGQGLDRQKRLLEEAGVRVFASNYQAARFCADLLLTPPGGKNG